jgi:long-chain fatty acid transport protein
VKNKALFLYLLTGASLFAGSIDYLSQQDAEYFGNPALTGKIGVSGAYYNPAGTAFLEDGTYIQISNQTHLKHYKMEVGGESFKSTKSSPVIPSMDIVYKKNRVSYFLHGGALAGGGHVLYKGGIGTFEAMAENFDKMGIPAHFKRGGDVKGSSYYIGITGGMAYQLNDHWSIAGALRYVNATRSLKGNGEFHLLGQEVDFNINADRKGDGFGGVFGVNYRHDDRLNIGFRYETEVSLKLSNTEQNLEKTFIRDLNALNAISPGLGSMIGQAVLGNQVVAEWTDGHHKKRNLPAMMSLGASYKTTENLTLLATGNYYFIKDAYAAFDAYKGYHNGYEIAFGMNYTLTPKWMLMTGYQYTHTGANKNTYKDTDYALNAHLYGVGAKYSYNEKLDLMGTFATIFYEDGTSVNKIKYEKHVNSIGLAAIYKF